MREDGADGRVIVMQQPQALQPSSRELACLALSRVSLGHYHSTRRGGLLFVSGRARRRSRVWRFFARLLDSLLDQAARSVEPETIATGPLLIALRLSSARDPMTKGKQAHLDVPLLASDTPVSRLFVAEPRRLWSHCDRLLENGIRWHEISVVSVSSETGCRVRFRSG